MKYRDIVNNLTDELIRARDVISEFMPECELVEDIDRTIDNELPDLVDYFTEAEDSQSFAEKLIELYTD